MPDFSVLISVYKNEKAGYLYQALKSIINQTLPPTEIVIVKDGQLTEELDQCIEYFQSKNKELFKILLFKNNRGLGCALHDGLLACSYDYVARMDSDDIARPERFEKQMGYLINNRDIALLGTWIKEFSVTLEQPDSITMLPCDDEAIRKYAKHRNPFRHMTVIFKKDAVLASGNYRDFLWFEDYDLWIRILQNGYKTANLPEYLVDVRADKDMFIRRGGWKYLKQDFRFQKFLLESRFIGFFDFLINIIIRSFVRIIPNNLRCCIYSKFLREKNSNNV